MIERIHLSILRAIEAQGSLTAAADSLHLTQSALSHSIKKLERQVGVVLWEKDGRAIRLTHAGDYLLKSANRLLPQFEHIDSVLNQFAKGEKGSLRIGMECHPCYQWLLRVIEPYLELYPGIDVDVKQRFQFGGLAALFNYDIDVLVTPDPLQKKGVNFYPVFDYELVLVTSSKHNLAVKKSVVAEDLVNEVLLTYPVETARLDLFTQFLLPANVSPKKVKTIEATEVMLQMVAAGRGVAALPSWLAEDYAGRLSISRVRCGDAGIHKSIHLGVREGEEGFLHVQSFLALAKNTHFRR